MLGNGCIAEHAKNQAIFAVKDGHFRDRRTAPDEAAHVEKDEYFDGCATDLKDPDLSEKQGEVEVIPQRPRDGKTTDLTVMG